VVAPQGFEPRYAAPEAAVLPLNEGAIRQIEAGRFTRLFYNKSRTKSGQCDPIHSYSSLSTCNGFWPRMRKLAAQPVTVANTAVPSSATAVASHSM
jgi:hypothetical protein